MPHGYSLSILYSSAILLKPILNLLFELFLSIYQTCSGVVVSVAYWVFWRVGSFLLLFISVFFLSY